MIEFAQLPSIKFQFANSDMKRSVINNEGLLAELSFGFFCELSPESVQTILESLEHVWRKF